MLKPAVRRRGTYPTVEGTCVECHGACLACHGPLEGDCLSCRRGALLRGGAGCVARCPSGFRLAEEGERRCLACPENCLDCDAQGTIGS